MARKLNRVYWVVHRAGEEFPLTMSNVSEKQAQAQACRIVEAPTLGQRGHLDWNDLRRKKYYSSQATLSWCPPLPVNQ